MVPQKPHQFIVINVITASPKGCSNDWPLFMRSSEMCSACQTQKSFKCNRLNKTDYIHVQIHCIHHANVFFLSTINEEHCAFISQGISHADPIACQESSMADSSATIPKTYPYLVIHIYHTSILQVQRNGEYNHFVCVHCNNHNIRDCFY